jgi:small basic protein
MYPCNLFIIIMLTNVPFLSIDVDLALDSVFRGIENRMPDACTMPALAREVTCGFLRAALQQKPRAKPFAASFRFRAGCGDHLRCFM